LGLGRNPPSPGDIARIGKRHEALKRNATHRALRPEEAEHLYVLDALQKEFQNLTMTVEHETAALRSVDEKIRYFTAERESCRRESSKGRCTGAGRARLAKRLESLWEERRKRSLSWTDILKLQAGLATVLGGTTGLVEAIAVADDSTTALVAETGKWRPLLAGLAAVGVYVGGAASFATTPLTALGGIGSAALFAGMSLWSGAASGTNAVGLVTAAAAQNTPHAPPTLPTSDHWPTGHTVPLHPRPLAVYAARTVDDIIYILLYNRDGEGGTISRRPRRRSALPRGRATGRRC
jgi:hypothetical protein